MREPPLEQRQRVHLAAALSVIALTAVAVSTCTSCARPIIRRSPHNMVDAAVTIKVTCFGDRVQFGSGVVVSPRRVLTAAHVVKCQADPRVPMLLDADKIEVDAGDGVPWVAVVAGISLEQDVAALDLPFAIRQFTPVEQGPDPTLGDQVCTATGGKPYFALKCGVVQPYTAEEIRIGSITFFAPVEQGNSGSGLYDYRGRLVGVVVQLGRCSNGQFCLGAATSLRGFEHWLR